MITAVVSARVAGLLTISSMFSLRSAKRFPIIGASRKPRSFKGRLASDNPVCAQSDFACRFKNKCFIILSFKELLNYIYIYSKKYLLNIIQKRRSSVIKHELRP